MRILFIVPPFHRLHGSQNKWGPHLGVSYLAELAIQRGHDAKVYNADNIVSSDHFTDQKGMFEGYRRHIETLHDIDHPIWKEVQHVVKEFQPQVVALTITTGTLKSAENVARKVKELDEDIVVVVGGPHATLRPDDPLENRDFDKVVMGEGERSFFDALRRHGRVFYDPVGCENLDELPFPRIETFLHQVDPNDFNTVVTSRGCPGRCVFCASSRIWGRQVRYRSARNVLEEIRFRVEAYGTNQLYFADDIFALNQNRCVSICEGLEGLGVRWWCESRVDTINVPVLEAMKRAGCRRIKIGIETGVNRLLRVLKKGTTVEQIEKAVEDIKSVGLPFTVYLLVGIPTATREEYLQTLNFVKGLDPDYFTVSITAPYYGTELYDMVWGNDGPPRETIMHYSDDLRQMWGVDKALLDDFLGLNDLPNRRRLID